MNWTVTIGRDFLKDLAKLPTKVGKRIEDFAFTALPGTDNPFTLGTIEKLKGYADFYKVRYGDYRRLENRQIEADDRDSASPPST